MLHLALPPSLTLAESAEVQAALRTQCACSASVSALVVDASALQTFDSSALSVLLGLRRHALSLGWSIRFVGLPATLLDLAQVYGVASLLDA
jgi:phospholipid transport system transporter-binding protein